MARLYAQLFTLVFLVVGVVGLFLGDSSHVSDGQAGGNLGSVTLHLTWFRDAVDLGFAAVFAWVGFVAGRRQGRIAVGVAGVLLLALAIAGFVIGDDDLASRGHADLNFPVAINVFDLVAGALAVLCALGTIEEGAEAA
jgi:hypothetical protein